MRVLCEKEGKGCVCEEGLEGLTACVCMCVYAYLLLQDSGDHLLLITRRMLIVAIARRSKRRGGVLA